MSAHHASAIRSRTAAQYSRFAKQRQKELERQAKEQARLSERELAKYEVSAFETQIDVLTSVHKECGAAWDWNAIQASLKPHRASRFSRFRTKAALDAQFAAWRGAAAASSNDMEALALDEKEYSDASAVFQEEVARWELLTSLAPRVLAGEGGAYIEVLTRFNPFVELSELGSAIHFTVHDAYLLEAVISLRGMSVIPSDAKALTSNGKLSVKPMPKIRFHEIYQDYVCSCVLRVARECLALLPIESVLVTARVESLESATGRMTEQSVLSIAMPRATAAEINFERIDPSDATEALIHRGDFKASRKSGAFAPIVPLTPADLPQGISPKSSIFDAVPLLQQLRTELKQQMGNLLSTRISSQS